ncbi:MAG: HlyC/CorC family transporter [Rhodospirillaceae bacterium]|nr:HlyC/CorC family transporter [Rhodospirillaceae bacterium]
MNFSSEEIWAAIGAIFLLLFFSAFFSGAETALTAVSRARIHQLAKEGNRRAKLIKKLHEHKERLIGTVLLANNLVNILASALATSLLIGYFGESGVAYATIVMTILVLVFAEVLPKTYAINYAEKTAIWAVPIIRVLVTVLYPLTHAVQLVVKGVLHLFGVKIIGDIGTISEEELRGAIDLHVKAEPEHHHERAMLRSILDLDQVEVGEIMVHRKDVFMIDSDLAAKTIVEQVLSSPYTRIPLWRGEADNIIGVIHAKTLLSAVNRPEGISDRLDTASLAAKPWFVPETTTLFQQLQAFRARREHFALVVDEYGALMGVVTLEDILEEIVGDISDEFDLAVPGAAVPGVKPQGENSYIIDGDVTLRDLNRRFDWQLPDEEAATLAGLVLQEAQRIPDIGQVFNFHGFRFEILRRHRNQITSLFVTPPLEIED